MSGADKDVPSPIDFHDAAQAEDWVRETVRKRPWRPAFFAAFAAALRDRFDAPIRIAELGSGPGHLADAILNACPVAHYTLIDFAKPMHAMARERLAAFEDQTSYVIHDFREAKWMGGLAAQDAVVSMQAVHETRHKRHASGLYGRVRDILTPGGWLLVADHYVGGNTPRSTALYMTCDEQRAALTDVGFEEVGLLLDEGDMSLFAARKPETV